MTRDARGPSIELLHTLLLFAEKGEVDAVARALGLDQAVISRRLRDLRTRYSLIQKRGRSLELTAKGRASLPAIRAWSASTITSRPGWRSGRRTRRSSRSRREVSGAVLPAGRSPGSPPNIPVGRCGSRSAVAGSGSSAWPTGPSTWRSSPTTSCRFVPSWPPRWARKRVPPDRATGRARPLPGLPERDLGRDGPGAFSGGPARPALAALRFRAGRPRPAIRAPSPAREALLRHLFPAELPIEAGGWEAALEYARHGLGVAVVPLALLDPSDRRDLVLRLLEPSLVVRDVLLDRSPETSPEHEAFRDALRQAATEEMLRVRRLWQTVFSRGVSP